MFKRRDVRTIQQVLFVASYREIDFAFPHRNTTAKSHKINIIPKPRLPLKKALLRTNLCDRRIYCTLAVRQIALVCRTRKREHGTFLRAARRKMKKIRTMEMGNDLIILFTESVL